MYGCLAEGYDVVATRRVNRKGEPLIRSFFARRFYRLMKKISHIEIVDGARDYRLITRQMAAAILAMTEYNRFSKGILAGSVSKPSGWNMKTSNAAMAKPNGLFGGCSPIPLRASPLFPLSRSAFPR
jgi:hypothetical protein